MKVFNMFITAVCVHLIFFFFAPPTDPPSREGGRLKTKHFIGMALPSEAIIPFRVKR